MPNRIQGNREKLEPINVRSLSAIPETNIMFNISCEPALKYSLFAMCDRGEDSKSKPIFELFLSKKLGHPEN